MKAVTDEDSATVSWDPSEGATGYGVSVDGKEYHTTANSLKVNNLTPNTDHSYQVKAKNAGGSSSFGAPKNAKTTPKAPASPKEETTKNDITVSWDPVDGATSYDVNFDDKEHRVADGTSKKFSGLTPNTNHTYAVRSNNADGSSRYGAKRSVSTLPNEPEKPSGTTTTPTKDSVTVSWPAVSGATSYDLVFGDKTYHVTGTSHKVDGLSEDTEYSYKVRANNAGGSSPYSEPKTVRTLQTPPSTPENVKVETTPDSVTVSWDPVKGAKSYDLMFDGKSYPVTGTSKKITGLKPDTGYTYQVRANNTGGSSPYSPYLIIRTPAKPPEAPKGVKSKSTPKSIRVSWPRVPGASGYDVEFDGKPTAVEDSGSGTDEPCHTFKGLKPSTEHSYRVRAKNSGGDGEYSPLEKTKTKTAKKK